MNTKTTPLYTGRDLTSYELANVLGVACRLWETVAPAILHKIGLIPGNLHNSTQAAVSQVRKEYCVLLETDHPKPSGDYGDMSIRSLRRLSTHLAQGGEEIGHLVANAAGPLSSLTRSKPALGFV